jgi:UDP-N-acetylglucosamine diphosphorylase / glucose-1-phosphate thymidylyltransferase / UDP-N-acetylgalactosamine diphosphorylase / glucosamine-1-phosphate N-acetyltransferase / galactosamine-1-phosphate N-acetyltransferase
MHLCIFEDRFAADLFPLTYFRPAFDLLCGILTLRQRMMLLLGPSSASLYVRPYLETSLREENPQLQVNTHGAEAGLFVNGRCIMTSKLTKALRKGKEDALFTADGEVIAARLSGRNLKSLDRRALPEFSHITGVEIIPVQATLVRFPWDLIHLNGPTLESDFLLLTKNGKAVTRHARVHLSAVITGRKQVYIGKGTTVEPGVVLNGESGPIYIGKGVRIYPNAALEGPCYVGDGGVIKIGSRIYGHTSLGPVCRVGGEVEHSIFQNHVNKQHDGFVGHSYLSPWVNLGAGTTTSNLKNTYGTVRVTVQGNSIDTHTMFLGLIAGDHVKIGINGTINTGTMIGPSCNLFGTTIPPKTIPAFTWGGSNQYTTYEVEKALSVATTVMNRREIDATDAYRRLFRDIFTMTRDDRAE